MLTFMKVMGLGSLLTDLNGCLRKFLERPHHPDLQLVRSESRLNVPDGPREDPCAHVAVQRIEPRPEASGVRIDSLFRAKRPVFVQPPFEVRPNLIVFGAVQEAMRKPHSQSLKYWYAIETFDSRMMF